MDADKKQETTGHASRCRVALGLVVIALCLLSAMPLKAGESIVILPSKFKLSGSAARQQLLVERFKDKLFVGQLTNGIVSQLANKEFD